MQIFKRALIIGICAGAAGLAGCDRDDQPQFYRAPKEQKQAAATTGPAATPPAGMADATPQAPPLTWTVPAGWKEMPARQMRYATFAVAGDQSPVELTVIPLGAEAGAILPNVNRWEEQIGLPKSPQADLAKVVRRITIDDTTADVVDLLGPAPADGGKRPRMLAAIIPHGQQVWFFKLLGPEDIVGQQKDVFEAFLKSIRFHG